MQKFDSTVSLVRVLSLLIVVVTHLLSWKGVNSFQTSTIGVACFLFISGYLYGGKEINNCIDWMKQRVKRVLVPFWILILFLTIYLIAVEEYLFAIKQLLETMLNLQGIHFLIKGDYSLGYMHLHGISHCWFLSILACVAVIVLRFFLKSIVDESVFYNDFFASFSANVCAFCLFLSIKKITIFFAKSVDLVMSSKLWKKIDALSFPIFLSHYLFLKEPFNIDKLKMYFSLEVLFFCFCTLVLAVIIDVCSKLLIDKINVLHEKI